MIRHLNTEIADLERQIHEHIDRHPHLRQKAELLESIPGVGAKTAARVISELPDVDQFTSAKQAAAYAGLTPAHRQSGSSVRGRSSISKKGNARLRGWLYFPAMTALRRNPILARFAARLLKAGKAKKLVLIAVMRKLLHMIYGVLKNNRPFDPTCQPANA